LTVALSYLIHHGVGCGSVASNLLFNFLFLSLASNLLLIVLFLSSMSRGFCLFPPVSLPVSRHPQNSSTDPYPLFKAGIMYRLVSLPSTLHPPTPVSPRPLLPPSSTLHNIQYMISTTMLLTRVTGGVERDGVCQVAGAGHDDGVSPCGRQRRLQCGPLEHHGVGRGPVARQQLLAARAHGVRRHRLNAVRHVELRLHST
jgi:hypothetical protein